jgi:hypothetical protein
MRRVISSALLLSLVLSVVPAIADDTFQAFNKMPATDRAFLTPLSDDQLASIEGARQRLNTGVNVAIITQLNICIRCTDIEQVNPAAIRQNISF